MGAKVLSLSSVHVKELSGMCVSRFPSTAQSKQICDLISFYCECEKKRGSRTEFVHKTTFAVGKSYQIFVIEFFGNFYEKIQFFLLIMYIYKPLFTNKCQCRCQYFVLK